MPLSITSVQPKALVAAEARIGNSGNFTALNYVVGVAWRFMTTLINDYQVVPVTAGSMNLYKPFGHARGAGRRIAGVLFTNDPHTCEELVEASDLTNPLNIIANGAAAPDAATALQFRFSFLIDKVHTCRKTFLPVAFGTYPGMDEKEWARTALLADSGRRDVIMLPWQVQMNSWNTNITNHVVTEYP